MLKGRKIFLIDGMFVEPRFYRHLRGGTFFLPLPGVKPQAESYRPFGIKSDKPEDYRHPPAFAVVEDVIQQGRLP
jgi:hypothetical protein